MPQPSNSMKEAGDYTPAKTFDQMSYHLAHFLEDTLNHSVLPASIPTLPDKTLPENPQDCEETVRWLFKHVAPYLNRSSLSPNYYGFVTGGTTPAALSAECMVSFFDQNVQVHLPRETIGTSVEVAGLNMLLDLFHLPLDVWGIGGPNAGGGTFTTGATASNILGLAIGREWVLARAAERATGKTMSVGEHGLMEIMTAAGIGKVQVLSTMPHSSIAKAASIIGIGRSNVISITKSGSVLDIDMEKFEQEVSKPGVASILALSTGEVNTGRFAIDSLEQMQEIRDICDRHDVWVHVDGAFGLFGRVLIGSDHQSNHEDIINGCQGVELADSITGDGHKLLNVPYDCGFFFTRYKGLAEEVFRNGNAAYLISEPGAGTGDWISSPLNIGIENSRRFRALPVYATLLTYGRQGYVDMLRRQISLARRIAGWLYDHPEYELLPLGEGKRVMIAKTFMIVLFRAVDQKRNSTLVKNINERGRIYLTGTKWDGMPAARIAVSNWQAEVDRDGQIIEEVLTQIVTEG